MKLELLLLFALSINAFLFIAQMQADHLAQEAGIPGANFYNYNDSFISDFDEGGYVLDNDPSEKLPDADQNRGVLETLTGFVTDIFSSIKNWLVNLPGINYIAGVVSAFPRFLVTLGLPAEIAYALGVIWHGFTLFAFVAWLKG